MDVKTFAFAVVLCGLSSMFIISVQGGFYDWMEKDNFDQVMDRMSDITPLNCKHKPESELLLPEGSISQVPQFNKLKDNLIFSNRSNLLHLHNMALNRAFFYSYIMQKMSTINDAIQEPGLLYHYFSTVADVAANPCCINGSGTFFDVNRTYPNFIKNVSPNNTILRFGPRSWRVDDYNEPTNWIREPTNHTIETVDYGAGKESNYASKSYKLNQWYKIWKLPDTDITLDSLRKHKYSVGIKFSNATGVYEDNEYIGFEFFGPSSPGQGDDKKDMPVLFTRPYFDCGRSNKWIVSAVSPIVDYLPRYLIWEHIRRHVIVAVASMDLDFLKIDLNQCPESEGNPGPNYFAGTDRCKPTTMCEPLPGYGFRRGGYQCLCRPGFRLPFYQRGPFQGRHIEVATEEEYRRGFECIPIGNRRVFPVVKGTTNVRKRRSVQWSKEELETNELLVAEQIFSKRFAEVEAQARSKKAQKEKSIKKNFLDLVNPMMDHLVKEKTKNLEAETKKSIRRIDRKITRTKTKTKSVLKRFRPKYSYNELKKEQFLKVTAPNLVDDENLKKKRRWIERYGAPWKEVLERKRTKFVSRMKRSLTMDQVRAAFDKQTYDRVMALINHKNSVNKENCEMKSEDDLRLPGDVAYGKEIFFEPQARVALRLAHFLSIFLQNVDLYEEYGNLRGDRFLNVNQTFGEVIANVMSDNKIKASGIFFDQDQYSNATMSREYFAPYAWKIQTDERTTAGEENLSYKAKDLAGMIKGKRNNYVFQPFFKDVKDRWGSNTYGLEKFTVKPMVRTDRAGSAIKRFEHYPMYYHGPKLEDGHWTPPEFDCAGEVKDWIITYAVPFFGLNRLRSQLEFKGVVSVTVHLDDLDLQQCPSNFYVANAFKNTARCDFESTRCVHLPGNGFRTGGYKCECKQGFEYPFNDYAWFYDGQTMEAEYNKMVIGEKSRFHTLKCREASASSITVNTLLLSVVLLISSFLNQR